MVVNVNYIKSSHKKTIAEWIGSNLNPLDFGISQDAITLCKQITTYYEMNHMCYNPTEFKKVLDKFKWPKKYDFHNACAHYILWDMYTSNNDDALWIELNRIKDKVRRFHFGITNVLHENGDLLEYIKGYTIEQMLTILA